MTILSINRNREGEEIMTNTQMVSVVYTKTFTGGTFEGISLTERIPRCSPSTALAIVRTMQEHPDSTDFTGNPYRCDNATVVEAS